MKTSITIAYMAISHDLLAIPISSFTLLGRDKKIKAAEIYILK